MHALNHADAHRSSPSRGRQDPRWSPPAPVLGLGLPVGFSSGLWMVLVMGLVMGLASGASAQLPAGLESRGATGQGLAVHHSFPEAGGVLRIVAEGFWPSSPVEVLLASPTVAPPSVVEVLDNLQLFVPHPDETLEMLQRRTVSDEWGRVTLVIELDDPLDVERSLDLVFKDTEGRVSKPLSLMVQPPTLLLPGENHVVRIDLRDGSLLHPPIPGAGGLLAAAFSRDGFLGYLLRDGGQLESWSARNWGGSPFAVTHLDPDSNDLAHAASTGPAFAVVRPEGSPFAPPGRVSFLDGREDLSLDPMAEVMSGRRWAIAHDGFTAFVAEDDLLVRQIDMLGGTSHSMFSAGLPGDQSLADMVLEGRHLYVASRRADGRPGSLTVLDLDTGWLTSFELELDPVRLLSLGDGRLLVIPSAESVETANMLVVVEDGVPAIADRLEGPGRILDAAPIPGGAAVLVADETGAGQPTWRLEVWDAGRGLSPWLSMMPEAKRLLAAGPEVVLMLGASSGLVHRVFVETGAVERIEGVSATGSPLFAVIP